MSTRLRFVPEEAKLWKDRKGRPIAIAEVTIRTLLGMFLLLPTPPNTKLILGVLGRAQERLDFELYGYAFLSNHGSMLFSVRGARHLAEIMNYIHSNIALEIGRKENSNWPGRFWGRRGRAILILGEAELADRLRYLIANSTKEHLVARPQRWPGAHCANALCRGVDDVGVWVDRTKLWTMEPIGRKRRPPTEEDAATHYPVRLEKIPSKQDHSDEEYREWIRQMCREISEEAAKERRQTGQSVLGVKRALRFHPHHQPDKIAKSPAPFIHCFSRETRRRFVDAYRLFADGFRLASDELHGRLSEFSFPQGGLPPTWYCGSPSG